MYRWSRYGGYECSSKGDKRFSAFYARIEGKSIEHIYHTDIKGYSSIEEGKGQPPLYHSPEDAYLEYKKLWRKWVLNNWKVFCELKEHPILSDRFANTHTNQARALAELCNEYFLTPSGKYMHYKGGVYTIVGVGKHTETEESFVVYKADSLWVRPLEHFWRFVGDKPRFRPI